MHTQKVFHWSPIAHQMWELAGIRFDRSPHSCECSDMDGLYPGAAVVGESSFWAGTCQTNQVECQIIRNKAENGSSELSCERVFVRTRFPASFFPGNFSAIDAGPFATNFLAGSYSHAPKIPSYMRQQQSRFDERRITLGTPPMYVGSGVEDKEDILGRDQDIRDMEPPLLNFFYRSFLYLYVLRFCAFLPTNIRLVLFFYFFDISDASLNTSSWIMERTLFTH